MRIYRFLLIIGVICLSSCASNVLYVKNALPNSRLVLEKSPDQKSFYSATYQSVTQEIYQDNIEIYNLGQGESEFKLDNDIDKYAVYFILPKISKENGVWKYLLNSSSGGDFSISKDGDIEKK